MGFFDVVNVCGLLFAIILLAPHIVYAKTHNYDMSVFDNRGMLLLERIGKYCSLFLMSFHIGILDKGFTSPVMQKFWFIFSAVMSAAYIAVWILFFKKEGRVLAYVLTILPAVVFMLSGLLQVNTLLLTFGVVFFIGQIYLTSKYCKKN